MNDCFHTIMWNISMIMLLVTICYPTHMKCHGIENMGQEYMIVRVARY